MMNDEKTGTPEQSILGCPPLGCRATQESKDLVVTIKLPTELPKSEAWEGYELMVNDAKLVSPEIMDMLREAARLLMEERWNQLKKQS